MVTVRRQHESNSSSSVYLDVSERERERDRERDTERERQRHRERETDRQQRERERQTDRQTDREGNVRRMTFLQTLPTLLMATSLT